MTTKVLDTEGYLYAVVGYIDWIASFIMCVCYDCLFSHACSRYLLFQILVGQKQVITLLVASQRSGSGSGSYPVNFPRMASALGVFTVRLLHVLPLSCITDAAFQVDLYLALFMPLLLLCVVFLAVLVLLKRKRTGLGRQALYPPAINAYGLLLFLVYPQVTVQLLQVFRCDSCGTAPSFVFAQAR